MNWQEFVRQSDREMAINEKHRGVAYTPDPRATTEQRVTEYMRGFGYDGKGARQVAMAVHRDLANVKRALHGLVEDGRLVVTEHPTRGPRASKRKIYRDPQSVELMVEAPYEEV